MAHSIKTVGKAVALMLAGVAAQAAHATAYYDLGANITATGASGDGSVVAAYDTAHYYAWTAAGGVTPIGGAWTGGIASVSADGTLISGSAYGVGATVQAAVYDLAAGRWKRLGGIGGESDGSASSAWGIAGNGESVVGLGWVDAGTAHAVQSTPGGTLQDLGSAGGSSRANGVNYDGSIVVGWEEQPDGYWQGAYWQNGVATPMFDNDGVAMSSAEAVSADGQWIVGDAGYGVQTWRYNTATGATQYLGDADPFGDVQGATGISADGRVIVGYDRSFGPPTFGMGTIWIDGLGMRNLTDYALGQGIDLNGRTLALPLGVSADGLTVVGLDNQYHGFVLTLAPVPEPASWALMGAGLAGLLLARRRRASAA
jgi:hypothetical protein